MEITIQLSRLFSKKFITHLEAKHEIENLGDLEVDLDISTEQGSVGFRDYAPNSQWSSHATEEIYGEIPYDVDVSFTDADISENLVWELTKAIETMVQEQDETLINIINE
jgi:hypothetical protein